MTTAARQARLRVEQTQWLFGDLELRLDGWVASRRAADVDLEGHHAGRQRSQLAAVEGLVRGGRAALAHQLETLADTDPDAVFAESWRSTLALAWLDRVWRFFRLKLDQRDGTLAPLLRAADEVVWSCWRAAKPNRFEARLHALGRATPPPPLAYVEPWFSPAALPGTAQLTGELCPDTLLPPSVEPLVRALPVPLLRLPPWCVGAPWWLVFVAHEVGHHWQHSLGLVAAFRALVETAAGAAGAGADDVERWGRWSDEVFADLTSVLLLGPWALWALVEVVREPAANMARRKPTYPPTLARLRIVAGALEQLGCDPRPALRGVELSAPQGAPASLTLDLAVAERVAALCQAELPEPLGRFDRLCDFDAAVFKKSGEIEDWRRELLGGAEIEPPRHVETARRLIAGSVAAWATIAASEKEGEALRHVAERLAERTLAALAACAPEGDRAGDEEIDTTDSGRALADALLALTAEAPP